MRVTPLQVGALRAFCKNVGRNNATRSRCSEVLPRIYQVTQSFLGGHVVIRFFSCVLWLPLGAQVGAAAIALVEYAFKRSLVLRRQSILAVGVHPTVEKHGSLSALASVCVVQVRRKLSVEQGTVCGTLGRDAFGLRVRDLLACRVRLNKEYHSF